VDAPFPSDEALRAALATSGAALDAGLSEAELDAVEHRFDFAFPPDLRRLLALALPVGDRSWPDWRRGSDEELAGRMAWPVDGILFDVEQNGFWHPAWPTRPATKAAAVDLARVELRSVPRLVPVFGHRYMPAVPAEAGNPVLSCYQTDVIYYGSDLLDWFGYEFRRESAGREPHRVPFWSDLMELDDGDSHQFW
jgi:hypothetical protein